MNIIAAHGYAHRLRADGFVESAPMLEEKEVLLIGDWKIRDREAMDLSGGDYEFIRNELVRLSELFVAVGRRLPVQDVPQEPLKNPSEIL